jgi:DMSO/TMAO reductase YedYZ molybdopterin-dependent catalytic subunit
MPHRALAATLECAGNSRALLEERVNGVPWQLGAVSTATWTGVSLAAVLERAGVRASAAEVILEGADRGEITSEPVSPGIIPYARSVPLHVAQRPDVLLASEMNEAPLTRAHGFPLRALVPGWYGMASVKWLMRVVVTDQPFLGYFQALDYTVWERREGLPALVALSEMPVKAQIARPAAGEVLAAGEPYRIAGAAWAGTDRVARVEVSADGGATWATARLLGEAIPYAWRLWELDWRAPERPGTVTLMARATDAQGRAQPMQRDPDRKNYMVTNVLGVRVELRAG